MFSLILKRYRLIFAALSGALVMICISYAVLTPEQLLLYSREHYAIENLTAFFLFVAAIIGLVVMMKTKRDKSVAGWGVYAFLCLAAAFRELSLHKAWTDDSILKSRFYLSGDVPIIQKLFGAAFIASLAYAAYRLLPKIKPSVIALWYGVNHVVAIYLCLGFFTVAKVLDAFSRLFPFWKSVADEYGVYMGFAEESLEMIGAFMLMMAPIFFWRHYKAQQAIAKI